MVRRLGFVRVLVEGGEGVRVDGCMLGLGEVWGGTCSVLFVGRLGGLCCVGVGVGEGGDRVGSATRGRSTVLEAEGSAWDETSWLTVFVSLLITTLLDCGCSVFASSPLVVSVESKVILSVMLQIKWLFEGLVAGVGGLTVWVL